LVAIEELRVERGSEAVRATEVAKRWGVRSGESAGEKQKAES